MKRLLLLLILSIFWTLAAAQISLPAASVQPDAAPVAPVGASAADIAATETVIVADPAVDSLSDPAPNAAEPVVRMTLDECMAYAVEHSPVVRQQDYTNRNYRQDYIESVAALVPSVSGSVSATTSFGRSVDPETNTYTDVSNLSNNYGVSGQMPVFAGFTGINTIRAAKVMRLMGVEELQRVKDEVALNTMQAYFDVVYYTESVRLAREQLETSTGNLAKSRKLLELGLKSAADVAEQDLLRIEPGQKVSLRVVGRAEPITGTVRLVEPTVDTTTRLGRVRIGLDDSGLVRDGMFGEATILVAERRALAAPVTAISADGAALKVEDGIVTRVAVETGIRDGGLVEIRSGLPLGATIVSRAGAFVRDGDHIHPVLADPGAATN